MKLIKDCIYGHIIVPDLCVSFMDTPEFQRLRRVRQLGVAHFAYPSAVHSRFEHSIGVMHLAGRLVDHLRNYVTISDRTKELIQLGGMYHDIGHLSFSHLFDLFLSMQKLSGSMTIPEFFRITDHEDRSLYFLHKVNERLGLLTPQEEQFVSSVIRGEILSGQPAYLFEIVCNRECGIDVDKMDYLHRDGSRIGLPEFQHDYILYGTVIDMEQHIAFRSKIKSDINDLFVARHRMHERVYQHHTTLKVTKLYFCMMQRLQDELYEYGEQTDDYNIESKFRNHPMTIALTNSIDNRRLEHDCEYCQQYIPIRSIKQSGCIENVRFV